MDYTEKEKDILKNNIFKIDAAIIRLLEKRLAYSDAISEDVPLAREELLSLVIDSNKERVRRIMGEINRVCFEEDDV